MEITGTDNLQEEALEQLKKFGQTTVFERGVVRFNIVIPGVLNYSVNVDVDQFLGDPEGSGKTAAGMLALRANKRMKELGVQR